MSVLTVIDGTATESAERLARSLQHLALSKGVKVALVEGEHALAAYPWSPLLHATIGMLYFRAAPRQMDNAMKHFHQALELDYYNASARLGLARIELLRSNARAARDILLPLTDTTAPPPSPRVTKRSEKLRKVA